MYMCVDTHTLSSSWSSAISHIKLCQARRQAGRQAGSTREKTGDNLRLPVAFMIQVAVTRNRADLDAAQIARHNHLIYGIDRNAAAGKSAR